MDFTSQARLIAQPGTLNARDLGGYPTRDGGTVRWRTLLRSDALHRLDDAGRTALAGFGLRTVVDLRTDEEARSAPSALEGTGARDVAGFTGIALLTAALLGGALSWIGPVAYLGVTMPALTGDWTTPWVWPARPPHDRGAAICAALVFAVGVALITIRGARDSVRE